jgi:hypothetical protein
MTNLIDTKLAGVCLTFYSPGRSEENLINRELAEFDEKIQSTKERIATLERLRYSLYLTEPYFCKKSYRILVESELKVCLLNLAEYQQQREILVFTISQTVSCIHQLASNRELQQLTNPEITELQEAIDAFTKALR